MTIAEREPWWASGARPEAAADRDDDVDPVTAHRSARRGPPASDDAASDDAASDDAASEEPSADDHDVDVCGVCPICLGLRALGDARPDLLAHLMEAARHLSAAAHTLLDEHAATGRADAPSGGGPSDRAHKDRVTRIDLD